MGKCQVFMLSLCRQTDGGTDRLTRVKQYAPDLSMWGHKNISLGEATQSDVGRKV